MQLYCDPISTTSRPILMFADEAGVALDVRPIELGKGQHLSSDYLAVNPNGLVPYLVDGDVRLGESTAILRYLADRTGSPAYPSAPAARAAIDEALGWFSTQFHVQYCLFSVYPRIGIPRDLPPELAAGLIAYGDAHVGRWLSVLDRQMLGVRPFVCGPSITLADYLGGAFVSLGDAVGYDLSGYPAIQGWIGRLKARPSWGRSYGAFDAMVAAGRPAEPTAAG